MHVLHLEATPALTWDTGASIATIFSALFTGVTIIYLVWQSKILSRSIRAQTNQAVVAMQMQVDKLLIEHHYAREYLYGDSPLPPAETEIGLRVRAIIDIAVNVIDNTYQQRDLLPKDMLEAWIRFAMETTERRGVQEYLLENPHWYPTAQSRIYRVKLEEMTGKPEPLPAYAQNPNG